ncbi:hypothetical protein DLJ49_01795 [Rhodovulum sp. 12E13]|uniref:PilZ domain-containing protein n=1 Tax=Rhodovulum sp. 12E13 TaxID=2203891 RepID=UPI000E194FC1|nr:PilZ domain-containing protein [Rhodovulum sp. 12E13]RDC74741.1 hypothetical protein DLJ49_01795 [Rhodovulum sp. 12E13]
MIRAVRHGFRPPPWAIAAVFAVLPLGGGTAAADALCALLLEVETEAADALEGRMPPPDVAAARIEQIGTLAAAQVDLSRQLLALSLAYRSARASPSPVAFATSLRRAASELRWLLPACDLPAMDGSLDGRVVTPRPPATAARDPRAPADDPGGLAPAVIRRSGEEGAPLPGAAGDAGMPGPDAIAGRVAALVAPAILAAAWIHWHFVGRPAGARRYPCRVRARMRVGDLVDETRVEDISIYGARLRLQEVELEIGDMVEVTCPHFRRIGRVQWANASYAGLRFRQAVSRGVIEACIRGDGAHDVAAQPAEEAVAPGVAAIGAPRDPATLRGRPESGARPPV